MTSQNTSYMSTDDTRPYLREHRILGCTIAVLTMAELNNIVADYIAEGSFKIVTNHNLHSLYIWHRDGDMRMFHSRADCTHIDGMGVVLLARLLGIRVRRDQRVTYVDWMPHLMGLAHERRWRVFFVGSRPGVAESAAGEFRRRFPGIIIGTRHGYFNCGNDDGEGVLEHIRGFSPDLLLVGMGMPRQERWILANAEKLPPSTVLTAGAAFDYFAGVIPTPPRWAGRLGLEWLFRLLAEPSRLWRRYLVEPWVLALLLVRGWVRK
jgi:N-acetylglucosaminyldiphosphoundecaprenol N-acetyl-beta-D-mannosaminyltransferase